MGALRSLADPHFGLLQGCLHHPHLLPSPDSKLFLLPGCLTLTFLSFLFWSQDVKATCLSVLCTALPVPISGPLLTW